MNDDDVPDLQKMLGMMMTGMAVPDDSADFVKNQKRSLNAIATHLELHESSFLELKEKLYRMFEPSGPIKESGDFENYNAYNFFHRLGSEMDDFYTNSLAKVSSLKNFNDKFADENFEFGEDFSSKMALASSIKQADFVSKISVDVLVNSFVAFEDFTENLYKKSVEQYRYLQKRYLNLGETGTVRYRNPLEEDDEGGYDFSSIKKIRIQPINDNVMLTDLLLDVAEGIPKYYTINRSSRERPKKKEKPKKYIDRFSLDRMARIFLELAEKSYLAYLEDPKVYMHAISEKLNEYYELMSPLEAHLRQIIEEQKKSPNTMVEMHGRKLNSPMADPGSISRRIQSIDYKGIKPHEEDTKPRNPTEKKVFRAQRELLMHIYSALKEISGMPDELKYDAAYNAVEKAVNLKENVKKAGETIWKKKIERDARQDNEFYVGQTAELGQITYVREAVPEIKMSDIVGKSFRVVKEHMHELMETYGRYPQLYLATAPRRKIKSNIICIGAYGCGKTELGRAIAGDSGSIAARVSSVDVLTCMFGEYEKNVKRVWEGASDLKREAGGHKLVHLLLDEFDAWFSNSEGHWVDTTKKVAQKTLQECLDGVVDYEGVITWGFTNEPQLIPAVIYRRFKHVEVVGQLDNEERMKLFKMLLTKGLPLSHGFRKDDYSRWSDLLDGATGEIIGKVCDSVHEQFIGDFCKTYPREARNLNNHIRRVRTSENDVDYPYIKRTIGSQMRVSPVMVEAQLQERLRDPITKELIEGAKETYANASKVLSNLYGRKKRSIGFGSAEIRAVTEKPCSNGSSVDCSTRYK